MGNGAYTQEGIMYQMFVAFGQGTGSTRVSQDAAVALRGLYFDAITPEVVGTRWAAEAVQVLERIRAIGKLAAFHAMQRGDTSISATDVQASAETVQTTSDTDLCPPRPQQ
jgi:hypothetical protein